MNKSNSFSIIIITYNREHLVEKLLSQIKCQAPEAEILLVHNSDRAFHSTSLASQATILINKKFETPAIARNEALKHASRPWIIFFDDDIILPEDYFQQASGFISSYPCVDIFGGPDQTPRNSTYFQTALGLTLQSPMATAHTRARHLKSKNKVIDATERDLILCHLWVRKDFISKHSLSFPSDYFRNEENLFIHQAKLCKARILYFSDLYVYHYRKSQLGPLFFAVFRSGLYRIKSFREMFTLSGLLFLIPIFWLILFSLSIYLQLSSPHIPFILKFIWLLYFTLSIIATAWTTKKRPQYFIATLFYQFFINLIYGLGALVGLFRLLSFL